MKDRKEIMAYVGVGMKVNRECGKRKFMFLTE